jgi:hypothetical protein
MSRGISAPECVARGAYPDIAADALGNLHLVYGKEDALCYKKYIASSQKWSDEQSTGIDIGASKRISRSEPCIVVDSHYRPHVFAGCEYAYLHEGRWLKSAPKPGTPLRDTNLAIDRHDHLFLVHRGGNNGGYIGVMKRSGESGHWEALEDPDKELPGRNNHVYGDVAISPVDQSIHIVYRHGKPRDLAYRTSADGGNRWLAEGIADNAPESPHIVVDYNNSVFAADGHGYVYRRTDNGWIEEGRPIVLQSRMQPYLTVDKSNHIYIGGWGGRYNVRNQGLWLEPRQVASVTGESVGFMVVEGGVDCAYVVWEESGTVDADSGAGQANLVVGKINSDGEVTGISHRIT